MLAAVMLLAAMMLLWRERFGAEWLAVFSEPERLRQWFAGFGPWDEAVFVAIRAAQTCFKFIPAEPLELASGFLWGPWFGMLWCLLGNTLGSCIILLLVRRFGRRLVEKVMPAKAEIVLHKLEGSEHLYALLTLIYLIPGTPKDGIVYLAGLMTIDLRAFMVINIFGRIPSILSSTLCGAAMGEKQYLLSAVIFAVTMLLALLGGMLYRRRIQNAA